MDLSTGDFGEQLSFTCGALAGGFGQGCVRRGEVQAAMAADKKTFHFTMSTVSGRPIEGPQNPIRLCGFSCICVTISLCKCVERQSDRLLNAGVYRRYACPRGEISRCALWHEWTQCRHTSLSTSPTPIRTGNGRGLLGRPHDLGNVSKYLGKAIGLEDYIGWFGNNFDPSISWKDLEWIRDFLGWRYGRQRYS